MYQWPRTLFSTIIRENDNIYLVRLLLYYIVLFIVCIITIKLYREMKILREGWRSLHCKSIETWIWTQLSWLQCPHPQSLGYRVSHNFTITYSFKLKTNPRIHNSPPLTLWLLPENSSLKACALYTFFLHGLLTSAWKYFSQRGKKVASAFHRWG